MRVLCTHHCSAQFTAWKSYVVAEHRRPDEYNARDFLFVIQDDAGNPNGWVREYFLSDIWLDENGEPL